MQRESGWLQVDGRALFVHLHEPDPANRSGVTVLIVQGIGDDYFHGYRALRFLADCFAEAGHRCVRFDYSGCGHSLDNRILENVTPEEPEEMSFDVCSMWEQDVCQVTTWLRSHFSGERLCFVANRSGALFINTALRPEDDLILWGAEKTGRGWAREIRTLAALGQKSRGAEGFESGGIWFDNSTIAALSGYRLAPVNAPRRAVVLTRADRPGSADVLSDCAADVVSIVDGEYSECFREPHYALRPERACRSILQWVENHVTRQVLGRSISASPAVGDSGLLGRIQGSGWTEEVCRAGGLFGICTRKDAVHQKSSPVLLLSNAGSVHAVGPNRLNVDLARQLASQDVTTLRYDLSNLGDSVCEGFAGERLLAEENHPYPSSADHDISAVVQWARTRGYSRVILAGLCSGAYAAFDFARTHLAAKPDEVLMINPLTFNWRAGMSLEIPSEYATVAQGRAYQKAILDRSRWMRVLKGDVSLRNFILHLGRSVLDKSRVVARRIGVALHLLPEPQLARDLLRIAATGTRIRFYFSSGEPGIDMLGRAGRSSLEALKKLHLMSVDFIAGADHTFRNQERRRELFSLIKRNIAHDPNV